MIIALACTAVKDTDREGNLQRMIHTIEDCKDRADLVVFGETALQGFGAITDKYEQDEKNAVSLKDPDILRICTAASHNHLAVSFGYLEKDHEILFSSQVFIDHKGQILENYHRVSPGWKDTKHLDIHYQEGKQFHSFTYLNTVFAIALCGDLWEEGRSKEMKEMNADIVLWPIWCDYNAKQWNESIKYEYAVQASLCGDNILLVNPYCLAEDNEVHASGGSAFFLKGKIKEEMPAGKESILFVHI